jgi:hypothetical protein
MTPQTANLHLWLADTQTLHDTGLGGMWDGEQFVIPFQNDMTAEECARIVARALVVAAKDGA